MARSCFENIDLDAPPRLDLAALIDISFLLLVFFLVAAALQRQEADLSVVLPGAEAGGAAVASQVERLRIAIDAQGTFRINDQPLTLRPGEQPAEALVVRLRRYAAVAAMSGTEPRVAVTCHSDAAEQRFIDALNACRAAGVTRIGIID